MPDSSQVGGSTRAEDGFGAGLRFGFCDDLFFRTILPFLPDDITYELLRMNFTMQLGHTQPERYNSRFNDIFR
jgi:hypothetical protein